jgi:hypothetical protein
MIKSIRIYTWLVVFLGMMSLTWAEGDMPSLPADILRIQATTRNAWVLWLPSVMIYDLSNQNIDDANKIDMVVTDSQGRDATIPVSKSVIKRLNLESGDFLTISHHHTGSLFSKDKEEVVYLIAPKGILDYSR